MILNKHVLVLNQNYEPLSVCNTKKAVILIFLGKAELIEQGDGEIRSISTSIPCPSVVRLSMYIKVPRKRIVLSRKNIIKRDNHKCQYCGVTDSPMTVDHVVPKVRGGTDSWENLVCACIKCNNKKGNRAPEVAGIKLLRTPVRPTHLTFIRHFIGIKDEKWKPYLFMV